MPGSWAGRTVVKEVLVWCGGGDASGRKVGHEVSGRGVRSGLVIDTVTEAKERVRRKRGDIRLGNGIAKEFTAKDPGESPVGFFNCLFKRSAGFPWQHLQYGVGRTLLEMQFRVRSTPLGLGRSGGTSILMK